jgi:putative ABC transport system permease protein
MAAQRIGVGNQGAVTLYNMGIDYDFIPAYGLEMKTGRNFSKEYKTDEKAVLLNEKAVRLLGFENSGKALNEYIYTGRDTAKIVGIVTDYHHQGLQKAIDPMIFRLRPNQRNAYSVKITTGNLQQTILAIEKIWNKHFPADPFNYYFLDESFDSQYKTDRQFGKIFGLFSFLAILIACFGLLGLSAFNVLQRTKEIGVRKILGASVPNILFILSRDFLKLVFISFILAIPFTWWIMHNWLQDFAYRIEIPWWVFVLAGCTAFVIALATIIFQAMKAAVSSPAISLRAE